MHTQVVGQPGWKGNNWAHHLGHVKRGVATLFGGARIVCAAGQDSFWEPTALTRRAGWSFFVPARDPLRIELFSMLL